MENWLNAKDWSGSSLPERLMCVTLRAEINEWKTREESRDQSWQLLSSTSAPNPNSSSTSNTNTTSNWEPPHLRSQSFSR